MTRTFCDICGAETGNLKKRTLLLAYSGGRSKDLDVCEMCSSKLDSEKRKAEVDFLRQSVWWKENCKHMRFESVGTAEQGGFLCPNCGHVNNAYTFKGKCDSCGYEEIK